MGFADALTWDAPKTLRPGAPDAMRIPANVQAQREADRERIFNQEIDSETDPAEKQRIARARDMRDGAAVSAAPGQFSDAMAWGNTPARGVKPAQPVTEIPSGYETVPETPAKPKPLSARVAEDLGGKNPLGEAALSMITSAVAAPIGAVAGLFHGLTSGKYGTPQGVQEAAARAKEVTDSLTYSPRTEGGRETLGTVSKAIDASKIAGIGPTEGITLAGLGAAKAAGKAARPLTLGPQAAAEAPAGAPAAAQMASAGAAAAAPREMALAAVSGSSPELRGMVEQAVRKNQPINLKTLDRHVEADSLPVPVHLTEGQATQDVGILSNEQNQRGRQEGFRNRFNEQNTKLIENTNAIRENAAPDVYATTIPEHGEILIDAYKTKDTALNAAISKRYQALRDANGGNFPLDSKQFVANADAALHKELLFDHVPPTIRKTLDRLSTDGMSFENFESLRTNLARIQRSVSADGNERAAAGVIRNALEELPMPPGADQLKPLADAARAAARERFALIESDPAYKAVVNGKARADKFVEKFIVGAEKNHVETLVSNLDETARQAAASGVVNYLKSRAGIIGDAGNFSQAGFNKGLEGFRPKLGVVFKPTEAKQLETLGNVARYTQAQPRGSFVNNSNTATTLIAESAKSALEGAANVAAKGVPVGTWTRKLMGGRAEAKAMARSLQTGAGIHLKDVK